MRDVNVTLRDDNKLTTRARVKVSITNGIEDHVILWSGLLPSTEGDILDRIDDVVDRMYERAHKQWHWDLNEGAMLEIKRSIACELNIQAGMNIQYRAPHKRGITVPAQVHSFVLKTDTETEVMTCRFKAILKSGPVQRTSNGRFNLLEGLKDREGINETQGQASEAVLAEAFEHFRAKVLRSAAKAGMTLSPMAQIALHGLMVDAFRAEYKVFKDPGPRLSVDDYEPNAEEVESAASMASLLF